MNTAPLPSLPDHEALTQLPVEQLVAIIMQQQAILLEQQRVIQNLTEQVNQLKVSLNLDSQTSSKPPSTDLLKKPEKALAKEETAGEAPKRQPGGQPGHQGKTRKGFERVDRVANSAPPRMSPLWL